MRKIIVCILLILTTALQASAGCGWVLWQKYNANVNKKTTPEWRIVEAFPSYDLCMENMASQQKSLAGTFKAADVLSTPPSYIAITSRHGNDIVVEEYKFYCLPGSLNPRE
jgi:hypothetical protein